MKVSDGPTPLLAVGAFDDEAAARAAIAQLRASGVQDALISVARGAGTAAPPPEAPLLSRVFWSGFWWSVVGGAAGGLAGLLIGVSGLGLPGTPDTIAIQVASWAMFAHVLGALLGCYLALDTGDRFAQRAHHHDAETLLVRVRVPDAQAAGEARRIMRESGGRAIDPVP